MCDTIIKSAGIRSIVMGVDPKELNRGLDAIVAAYGVQPGFELEQEEEEPELEQEEPELEQEEELEGKE
jgi:hypothetical protein